MRIRLAVLAASVALFAAAPVWAGTMTVDFTDHYVRTYQKHIGHEWRNGDHISSNLGSGLAKGDTSSSWVAPSGTQGTTTDAWVGPSPSQQDASSAWVAPNTPPGGNDQCSTDPPGSTTAPEPSDISLFAIALIGLGIAARRHYSMNRA
ncbi:MAG TPA: hypothetical protein VMI06_06320 [Terriglobia bacterium]|nr:hypothetical protein [Terriglobia bacterium]